MDYQLSRTTLNAAEGLTVKLAPGGGWAAIVR